MNIVSVQIEQTKNEMIFCSFTAYKNERKNGKKIILSLVCRHLN